MVNPYHPKVKSLNKEYKNNFEEEIYVTIKI
jgi:hypothetical protein